MARPDHVEMLVLTARRQNVLEQHRVQQLGHLRRLQQVFEELMGKLSVKGPLDEVGFRTLQKKAVSAQH